MEITPNLAALPLADPFSKAYPEKLHPAGEATDQAAGQENALAAEGLADKDVVSISEEAYKRQQEDQADAPESGLSLGGAKEEEEPAPANMKDILRKQIREVQKQLSEARQRLAAAMAEQQGREQAENKPAEAGADALAASGNAAMGNDEVKTCAAEISQLTATLLNLNNQLMQEEKKAATPGAMGSAGINSHGGDRGGLGERMVTRA